MAKQPGLDLQHLRGLRGRRLDTSALLARIDAHLDAHDGYVAVSGGKDSIVVAHLARQVDPAVPMVWFDSGLEFPETRRYLEDLADTWSANFHVVQAHPTLLELLVASGNWDHEAPAGAVPALGEVLIEAPARLAHENFGDGELWGVRAQEAAGRRVMYAKALRTEITRACHGCCPASAAPSREQRAAHGGIVRRLDGTVAFGPIWDWKTDTVWEYLAAHQVPANPLYDKLRRLGAPDTALRVSHVLDGARVELGRVTWLRRGWPALNAELETHLPRISEFL